MDLEIYSCPICGWGVGDEQGSTMWDSEFRGLYKTESGDLVLTGVGRYDPVGARIFVAPSDPTLRWDSPEPAQSPPARFGAMMQPPFDSRYGFVFHDACWSLLETAYHPGPVPLLRLYDVCMSLPFMSHASYLSWEHDYAGLILVYQDPDFPWLPEETGIDFAPENDDPTVTFADFNPFDVPEIESLLQAPPDSPPHSSVLTGRTAGTSNDCFHRIPLELCTEIAKNLSVADFRKARLASRALSPVFHSQSFWASQFKRAGDRSWLFEAYSPSPPPDWRSLFRRTADSRLTPALRNRKRVWGLIMRLKQVMDLEYCEPPPPSSPPSPDEAFWDHASVRMEGCNSGPLIGEVCRKVKLIETGIIRQPSQFTFFFVFVGDVQYICGFQLTTLSGERLELGYRSNSFSHIKEIPSFRALRVAVRTRGITAIQICGDDGHASPWQGNPTQCFFKDVPVNPADLRLVAVFDGCKLIELSIGTPGDPFAKGESWNPLQGVYWFPQIPPQQLHLNEEYLKPRMWPQDPGRPVFWSHFGGSRGKFLRHVVAIRVTMTIYVHEIEIRYDDRPGSPRKAVHFGWRGYYSDPQDVSIVDFAIDGSGGEFISGIDTFTHSGGRPGSTDEVLTSKLVSFKIHTNFGNSHFFRGEAHDDGKPLERKLTSRPGTTITGLYACLYRDPNLGLAILGAMSENVEEHVES